MPRRSRDASLAGHSGRSVDVRASAVAPGSSERTLKGNQKSMEGKDSGSQRQRGPGVRSSARRQDLEVERSVDTHSLRGVWRWQGRQRRGGSLASDGWRSCAGVKFFEGCNVYRGRRQSHDPMRPTVQQSSSLKGRRAVQRPSVRMGRVLRNPCRSDTPAAQPLARGAGPRGSGNRAIGREASGDRGSGGRCRARSPRGP